MCAHKKKYNLVGMGDVRVVERGEKGIVNKREGKEKSYMFLQRPQNVPKSRGKDTV